MCRHPPKLTRTDQLFPYAPHFRSQSAVIAADRASRARAWILPAAPSSPSSTSVRWPTPRSRQNRVTISASAALSGLKPWSTVRARTRPGKAARSEEHTSELQSLMRISYAVSCLQQTHPHHPPPPPPPPPHPP